MYFWHVSEGDKEHEWTSQDEHEFIIKECCLAERKYAILTASNLSNKNLAMQLYDSSFAVLSLLFLAQVYNVKLFFEQMTDFI